MATQRGGKGYKAYLRKRKRLKAEQRDCQWCGNPIDYTLPPNHPLAFTADHTQAINNGGHIYKQDLHPMHRRCNSTKGDTETPTLRPAT